MDLKPIIIVFFLNIYLFVCAGCQLHHVGSLVAARKLLVAACGIQCPDQGPDPGPLLGKFRVVAQDRQGKSSIIIVSQQNCAIISRLSNRFFFFNVLGVDINFFTLIPSLLSFLLYSVVPLYETALNKNLSCTNRNQN